MKISDEIYAMARKVMSDRATAEGAHSAANLYLTGKWDFTGEFIKASEIIAAAYPLIEAQIREECARVGAARAKEWLIGQPMETRRDAPPDIAAAILAGEKADG